VYHDLGNLNVTVVVPGWAPKLGEDLMALIAGVLRRQGAEPTVTERGVFAGTAKVSGLAAHLTRAATLAHATLLVTTPAYRVQKFLALAPPDVRPTDSRRSPVLPLSDLTPGMSVPAACRLVRAEAAERYGPLVPRPVRAEELQWQGWLMEQRYANQGWHETGRAPAADSTMTSTS
jgi:lipoate-protein ligase A